MMKKTNKRYFTILELMIVIAVVSIAGGGLFWRLNRLVEAKRKESDVARLRGLLLSSRMLSINTKADWELEMQETKAGWNLRLLSLEEPGKEIGCGKLSHVKLQFNPKSEEKFAVGRVLIAKNEKNQFDKHLGVEVLRRIAIRFFSSGQVAPSGVIEVPNGKIHIPGFFRQDEGSNLGPLHPDDLKNL